MGKPARAERIGAYETMDASKNPGGNESILVIYEVEPVSAGVFTLECVRLIAYIYDICGCADVEPRMTLSGGCGGCDYVSFDAKAMA